MPPTRSGPHVTTLIQNLTCERGCFFYQVHPQSVCRALWEFYLIYFVKEFRSTLVKSPAMNLLDPCSVFPFPISSVVIMIELLQLTVVMDMVFITKYINTQPERICVES